ncbi:MAG: hypothetical protein ACFFA5_04580 [Promethearchaeota archaeon]
MILSVYIIDSFSGRCILSWSRILKKFNDALIGGFLIAISRFGREIGGEEAQFVSFSERKFIFTSKNKLIFVAEITSAKEIEIGRSILQQIMVAFIKDYGTFKEIIANADISIFWPFREKIEQLISTQIIKLEKLLNDVHKSSKASGVIVLNLSGDVFSAVPNQIADLSEPFIASIKMIIDAYEATTEDKTPLEVFISGLSNTLYIRRVYEDNFLLIYGSKEISELNLSNLVEGYLDEIENHLTTFGHIMPTTVATDAIILNFLEWSSEHPLLSQLNLQEYKTHFDIILKGRQGLYEFDCVLKSPTNIAFIRIYNHLNQSDCKFVQRFVDDVNSVCEQLDSTPVLFLAINKNNFTKATREFARQAIIQYEDMYFKLVLCEYSNEEFCIIEGLRDTKRKGGIL